MIYRWMENSEIEALVNPTLKQHGWAELNINESQPTCRVLGAFTEDGELKRSFTLQMIPALGPLVTHDESFRDSGDISRCLVVNMEDFLKESGARDFLVIANSPLTERLAERFGMEEIRVPVYVKQK